MNRVYMKKNKSDKINNIIERFICGNLIKGEKNGEGKPTIIYSIELQYFKYSKGNVDAFKLTFQSSLLNQKRATSLRRLTILQNI